MNNSTARWHRYRQRKRNGRVMLEVEAEEIGLEVLLANHGLLPCCGAKDHGELVIALEKLIEKLIEADAEEHET